MLKVVGKVLKVVKEDPLHEVRREVAGGKNIARDHTSD